MDWSGVRAGLCPLYSPFVGKINKADYKGFHSADGEMCSGVFWCDKKTCAILIYARFLCEEKIPNHLALIYLRLKFSSSTY